MPYSMPLWIILTKWPAPLGPPCVDRDLVPTVDEALHHVAAHPAESDESQLHASIPPIVLRSACPPAASVGALRGPEAPRDRLEELIVRVDKRLHPGLEHALRDLVDLDPDVGQARQHPLRFVDSLRDGLGVHAAVVAERGDRLGRYRVDRVGAHE